jgi:bis(5'-adenosyl)-triphosphatase
MTLWFILFLSSLIPFQIFAFSLPPLTLVSPRLFMSTDEPSSTTTTTTAMQQFGKFLIAPNHVFFRSTLSAAFVNLKPIVPGHVLVVPVRVVARLEDLTNDEYVDLFQSVRTVQNALKNYYNATGFNVAVQDGRVAGQSVPHVHVHILPRTEGDFERNDDVYDELEAWAPDDKSKKPTSLNVPEDKDRKDRTFEEMTEEAAVYKNLL